jgi:hydrogenase maturation protease
MNRALVDRIANAVLYEGYILYPHRPSTKNRQRWTFGGLCPEAYCREHGGEASSHQTEVLVRGTANTTVEVIVRFLHLTARLRKKRRTPFSAPSSCCRLMASYSTRGRRPKSARSR